MNEPKRRGRPPKALEVASGESVAHIEPSGAAVLISARDADAIAKAQAYAMRIWNGQSDTVTRLEKVQRVKIALEGQGMSMEGVVLP